jgi:hypothetical protein
MSIASSWVEAKRLPGRQFLPAQSGTNSAVAQTEAIAPLGDRHGLTVVRGKYVCPTIAGLFRARSPSAVARLVVTIVVNAIDGVLDARSGSHVGKEVLKGVPSLTDRDASTTVVWPSRLLRVGASRSHGRPRPILRCFDLPVRSVLVRDHLTPRASTTRGMTSRDAVNVDLLALSAVACAKPAITTCDLGNQSERSKLLTGFKHATCIPEVESKRKRKSR